MYQALYRKYRPKTFDDVVGQDVIIQTLKNSISNNKISHAYLLTGPRGCGKTTIAKIFAQLVNCENPKENNLCGECVFCTHIKEQTMDIIEMDAASNNGVDEIREINNKVNLVPSIGKYKIYIIDEVHMLTIGAFNALLKTLEEPPSHVIFILATTDPQKVPITILSRCQRFDLKKISEQKIAERLEYICEEENIDYEADALFEIAKLGDGCLRDSISILDQVVSYTNKIITVSDVHAVNGTISLEEISKLMNNVKTKNLTNIINSITEYTNQGKSVIKINEDIINYLKTCLLLKNKIEIKDIDKYNNYSDNYSVNELLEQIKVMNETLFDIKKFSDPKLLIELAFIKMVNLNVLGNQTIVNVETTNSLNSLGNQQIVNNEINNSITNEKKLDTKSSISVNEVIKEEKEEVKNNSKEEIKKEEKNIKLQNKNISWEIDEEIKNFIELRINNTLSEFSKKLTLEIKQNINDLMDYIMDEEYGKYVTTIMDGELKAASEKYMIFSYKTEHLSYMFNKNIEQIEKLIKKQFNKDYKVISVSNDKWDEIKKQFNNKEKKYENNEENIDIKEILNKFNDNQTDDMKSMFGELVEYK